MIFGGGYSPAISHGGENVIRKLKDIVLADDGIRTGLVLSRKKSKRVQDNKFKYETISLSTVDEMGFVNGDTESIYFIEELEEKYLAQKGDVLMRLSDPFTTIYIDEELEGTVISSMFTSIRVSDVDLISPRYLSIVLNSLSVKNQLRRNQSGTNIATASTKTISELDIPIISSERQAIIENVMAIHSQEKKLLKELVVKKDKLMNGIVSNLVAEMEE